MDPAATSVSLARARLTDVAGGSIATNVEITRSVLGGMKGPRRDIVVLNAGASLVIGKLARSLREGIAKAQASIDSGAAAASLQRLVEFSHSVANA